MSAVNLTHTSSTDFLQHKVVAKCLANHRVFPSRAILLPLIAETVRTGAGERRGKSPFNARTGHQEGVRYQNAPHARVNRHTVDVYPKSYPSRVPGAERPPNYGARYSEIHPPSSVFRYRSRSWRRLSRWRQNSTIPGMRR